MSIFEPVGYFWGVLWCLGPSSGVPTTRRHAAATQNVTYNRHQDKDVADYGGYNCHSVFRLAVHLMGSSAKPGGRRCCPRTLAQLRREGVEYSLTVREITINRYFDLFRYIAVEASVLLGSTAVL